MAFLESDAAGGLERQFVRVDVVIRAVVQDHPEVDDREAGEISTLRRFHDALFHRRNVVLRNRAAEDLVDELEVAAARQRLHLDLAIAELAVAAALLLVASLHVGAPANGLAIRNLRRLQVHLGVVAVLQLGDDDFDVLLAGAGDQEFLRLRIAEEAQHGVFFHQLVNAVAQLVFVGTRLGLDGEGDGRLRKRHLRILNRRALVAQGVAGQASLATSPPHQCRRHEAR